jgi:hypothetical protein
MSIPGFLVEDLVRQQTRGQIGKEYIFQYNRRGRKFVVYRWYEVNNDKSLMQWVWKRILGEYSTTWKYLSMDEKNFWVQKAKYKPKTPFSVWYSTMIKQEKEEKKQKYIAVFLGGGGVF